MKPTDLLLILALVTLLIALALTDTDPLPAWLSSMPHGTTQPLYEGTVP